ncbi:MAG: hypothetical protein R2751_14595 [Bacteroidales bacterium]
MKPTSFLFLLAALVSACNPTSSGDTESTLPSIPSGPYLGQTPPDSLPALFAPGIVSTGMFTRDVAISHDGKEIFFCVAIGNYTYSTILCCKEEGGRWTGPEIVPFSGGPGVMDFEPAFSPDGSRLYFLSTRPDGDEEPGDQDIWYVERSATGWGEPKNLGAPVNTDDGEFFPSFTRDGTLYFTRGSAINQIYRSRLENGTYQEPELLPGQVNCGTNRFNAFVSPAEDYIIVPAMGRADTYDGVDYYIVFRDPSDRWSEPVNMGPLVNADNVRGWSPNVSPDGKYFFFMATRTREMDVPDWNYEGLRDLYNAPQNGNADIFWVDASFIDALRKQAVFPTP